MDALSAALSSVRMTGAIFFDAVCTAPWGFAVPAMERAAHVLAPGTEHVVGYHLVSEGKAVVGFEGAADIPSRPGTSSSFRTAMRIPSSMARRRT
jgi:hypothetical protein